MKIEEACEISKYLQKKTFFSNPLFIMHIAHEKNGILYENDKINGIYPIMFYTKDLEELDNQIIGTAFEEDIEDLKDKYNFTIEEYPEIEFYYSTDSWIHMEGKKFKDARKIINKFNKEHNYSIFREYPINKLKEFMKIWKEDKVKKFQEVPKFFEEELKMSTTNLDLLENIEHKGIYIEENNKLIGFCIFFKLFDNFWVGLMQKTRHGIIGLPQLLYHLKSKEMGRGQIFSTGTDAEEESLQSFKEKLRPIKKKKLYRIFIKNKKNLIL